MVSLQDQMKIAVAIEAIKLVARDAIIGIGTGSTVDFFIEELAAIKGKIKGVVASSIATETKLKKHNFAIFDLNSVDKVSQYFDGADTFNGIKELVKGGGGALTREKILAAASESFICMVDESKGPQILGRFPVPIEVIPMARSFVAREIVKLKGYPVLRENFITDNGNIILDVHNWEITKPISLEEKLNTIPGVVENGIFAAYSPHLLLVAKKDLSVITF